MKSLRGELHDELANKPNYVKVLLDAPLKPMTTIAVADSTT